MAYLPPRTDRTHLLHLFLAPLMARWMLRLLHRAQIWREGPSITTPVILAANHRSFLDPILVGAFMDRPVAYFARASLWKYPIIGQTLEILGGFPIDRDEPQMAIMKRTVAALQAGTTILMFPEGTRTRSGRLGRMREGVALFSRRSGVPVVPVYLIRSEIAWPRRAILPGIGGRVGIVVGRPLVPPPGLPPRQQDRWLMDRLRDWMQRQERRHLGPAPTVSTNEAA